MPHKDPEVGRAYQREYYHLHKEETGDARRARDAQNKRQLRARKGEQINAQRRANYNTNPELRERIIQRVSLSQMWRRHRLKPEAIMAIYEEQDGRCYLCGDAMAIDAAFVEHDHSCCASNSSCPICRRGLAHHRCNIAIGFAGDDPARLRRMADALEAAQLAVDHRKADADQQLTLELEA